MASALHEFAEYAKGLVASSAAVGTAGAKPAGSEQPPNQQQPVLQFEREPVYPNSPQRQPPSPPPAKSKPKPQPPHQRTEAELEELAKWPQQAHQAWKTLSEMEKYMVGVRMIKRYGNDFVQQFLGFTKSSPRLDTNYTNFTDVFTLDWFKAHGYRLVQKDSVQEWWTHPSGHEIVLIQSGTKCKDSADQKALEAALTKLGKAVEALQTAEREINGAKKSMLDGDPTDPHRPDEFDGYVKRLEELKGQAEAALADAENT